MRRLLFGSIAVAILGVSPYLLLMGREYVYDDVEFIANNVDLLKIDSFLSLFRFQLQPTKPVANFFIAFGYWMAEGRVAGQKIVSIALHLIACLLLLINLIEYVKQNKWVGGRHQAIWISVLFSILPIHSQAIAIGEFRGEILATCFSLVTLWMLQKYQEKAWFDFVLFVNMGLASMSKEVFVVILPILVFGFAFAKSSNNHRVPCRLAVTVLLSSVIWSLFLLRGIRLDSLSHYSYKNVLGLGLLPLGNHVKLAARAICEGLIKCVSGQGLTTIRLAMRTGIGESFGVISSLLLLVGYLGSVFYYFLLGRQGWSVWVALFGVSPLIYFLVPNINMGQEHYWYFSSIGVLCGLVGGAWRVLNLVSKRPQLTLNLCFGVYSIYLCTVLGNRLLDLRTRESLLEAEYSQHPESSPAMVGLASLYLDRKDSFDEIPELLLKAKAASTVDPDVFLVEVLYHLRRGELNFAEKSLRLAEKFPSSERKLARFYLEIGSQYLRRKDCNRAISSLKDGLKLDPENPLLSELIGRVSGRCPIR